MGDFSMALSEALATLAFIVSLAIYLKSHNNEKNSKALLIEQKKGELSFALVKASLLLQENKDILNKIALIDGGKIKDAINKHAIEAGIPMFDDFLNIIDKLEKEYKKLLADTINVKIINKPELVENIKNKLLVFNQQCEKILDGYNILIQRVE
jgi:hypothetical protein